MGVKERNAGIDLLCMIAIVLVVALHVLAHGVDERGNGNVCSSLLLPQGYSNNRNHCYVHIVKKLCA